MSNDIVLSPSYEAEEDEEEDQLMELPEQRRLPPSYLAALLPSINGDVVEEDCVSVTSSLPPRYSSLSGQIGTEPCPVNSGPNSGLHRGSIESLPPSYLQAIGSTEDAR